MEPNLRPNKGIWADLNLGNWAAGLTTTAEPGMKFQGIHCLRGSEKFCGLCEKPADGQHEFSSEHRKRVEEDAICTWMAGDAKSKRRFEPDSKGGTVPGFVGLPTQLALLEFWGDALPNFPKFAHDTLQN